MVEHEKDISEKLKRYFDQEDLPPQILSFSETFKNGGDIEIDDLSISEYHKWMESIIDRNHAYGEVWNHLNWQNKHLLSPLQVNNHAAEHGNRVAGLTGLLYMSIRGPQKVEKMKSSESEMMGDKEAHRIVRSLITVAEPAGQMHDVGYAASAAIRGKNLGDIRDTLSSNKQRGVFNKHAEYGAQIVKHGLEKVYKDPTFYRKFFQEKYAKVLLWTGGRYHDMFNQCVRAIRKHTSEQIKNPLTEQQTSGDLPLLVFCADKLDFVNRAPETIDKARLFENGPQIHQRLNLSITNQKVRVSQKERHVEFVLRVDPSIPEVIAKEENIDAEYSPAKFQEEFFNIYGGSFEEIETIFKVLFTNDITFNGEDLDHSTFSVTLRFPDGTRFSQKFVGRREEHPKEVDAEDISTDFLKKMDR